MKKILFIVFAIVLVATGLFFLLVPFSTLQDWGIVLGGRVGNLITGLAALILGGVLGFLAFRRGVARDLSSKAMKSEMQGVSEDVIRGKGPTEEPPAATAPTPTPPEVPGEAPEQPAPAPTVEAPPTEAAPTQAPPAEATETAPAETTTEEQTPPQTPAP